MPRARSWNEVRVGTAALVITIAGAAAVLVFARVGALHGDTIRLYAATPHARGILPGSEVWLGGQKVGLVRNVGFRPPSTDTSLRVLLTLDVLEQYRDGIRRRARVTIRPGGSLIGSPVVAIDDGLPTAPPARAGDTLVARVGSEFESMRAQLTTTLGTEVPLVLDNIRVLGAQLTTARGTLGALGVEGPERLSATASAGGALAERALRGDGTVGLALRRGELTARARAALARVGALRARAASPHTTIGRLRGGDSAVLASIISLRDELATVQALLDEPRGSAGRLQHDRALQAQLARSREELELLLADLRRYPLRYVNP